MITCGCLWTLYYYRWSFPPLLSILPVFPWKYVKMKAPPPSPVAPPFISTNQWESTLLESSDGQENRLCFFIRTWWEMLKELLLHARNGVWRKHFLNPWAQNKGFLWDMQGKGKLHFMPFIGLCFHKTHQWLHLLVELLNCSWSKGLGDSDMISASILDPCEMNTIS